MKILAVADSDSYLKWSAATLAALPRNEWAASQLLVRNPLLPTAAQVAAAAGRAVPVVTGPGLRAAVRRLDPDVVLLACTGPVVDVLTQRPLETAGGRRPVVVTGLPGISVPASRRAVHYRRRCDLLVVHSHRERAEFAALAAEAAPGLAVGLARLPFLRDGGTFSPAAQSPDVVFAAQARVPAARSDRQQILLALAAAGSAVVKLRGGADEPQTHDELWPYDALWTELTADGRVPPGAVRFTTGPMADALRTARGLVTVSSTAALEAVASRIGVLVLTDFGVSTELGNLGYADSGCLGTLEDLAGGRFRLPPHVWRERNYFHDPGDDDWLVRLADLLEDRVAGRLPVRGVSQARSPAALRRRLRLQLPPTAVATGRRLRARARRRAGRRELR